MARLDALRHAQKGSVPTAQLRLRMQKTMQNNAAVFRTSELLREGCEKIDHVFDAFADVRVADDSLVWNTDLIETLELENLLINAQLTMHRRARGRMRGHVACEGARPGAC